MSYDLTIAFSGVCAYVPRSQRKEMMVLLLDAVRRAPASNGVLFKSHIACIEYRLDQWTLSTDYDAWFPRDGQRFGLVFLGSNKLSLRPEVADSLNVAHSGLLKIGDLSVNASKVDENLLTGGAGRLAARLSLTQGTFKPILYSDKSWYAKQLSAPPPTHPRLYEKPARTCGVSMTLEQPAVITAVDLATQDQRWTLTKQDATTSTHVCIKNIDLASIELSCTSDPSRAARRLRSTLAARVPSRVAQHDPDIDFELFYRLCKNQNADRLVPHVWDSNPSRAPRCMQALFEETTW